MPTFMVITSFNEYAVRAFFYDDYDSAKNRMMETELEEGRAELYVREKNPWGVSEYRFAES